MPRIQSPTGAQIAFDRYGNGPLLVLVHGGFSDHVSNWEFVKPWFEKHFTVVAIARRGRGETDATSGHSIEDESCDVAAVIESLDRPVFLLGHSYGALTALAAAVRVPDRIRKLVLYEPAWPHVMDEPSLAKLETFAQAGDWDQFAVSFFHERLRVPMAELEALRETEIWPPILTDAPATLGDLRALCRHDFVPERYRALRMPVMLQIGSESPRDLYATDALAAVLPDARIGVLEGQAHEGMTTAPALYAEVVAGFLLEAPLHTQSTA